MQDNCGEGLQFLNQVTRDRIWFLQMVKTQARREDAHLFSVPQTLEGNSSVFDGEYSSIMNKNTR